MKITQQKLLKIKRVFDDEAEAGTQRAISRFAAYLESQKAEKLKLKSKEAVRSPQTGFFVNSGSRSHTGDFATGPNTVPESEEKAGTAGFAEPKPKPKDQNRGPLGWEHRAPHIDE